MYTCIYVMSKLPRMFSNELHVHAITLHIESNLEHVAVVFLSPTPPKGVGVAIQVSRRVQGKLEKVVPGGSGLSP